MTTVALIHDFHGLSSLRIVHKKIMRSLLPHDLPEM